LSSSHNIYLSIILSPNIFASVPGCHVYEGATFLHLPDPAVLSFESMVSFCTSVHMRFAQSVRVSTALSHLGTPLLHATVSPYLYTGYTFLTLPCQTFKYQFVARKYIAYIYRPERMCLLPQKCVHSVTPLSPPVGTDRQSLSCKVVIRNGILNSLSYPICATLPTNTIPTWLSQRNSHCIIVGSSQGPTFGTTCTLTGSLILFTRWSGTI
jgi:hypothetical protein